MEYFRISLIILCFTLIVPDIKGQNNNTSSPYSRFGIGDINKTGFARNRAMGNTGIALRSKYHLNNVNPASYSIIDSTTFIFDIGGVANFYKFKTNNANKEDQNFNFEYFTFGLSITSWWDVSLGLHKRSDVGYDITIPHYENDNRIYTENYNGSGGLNSAYLSHAFKYKNYSFGVNFNYTWGKILLEQDVDFVLGLDYNNKKEFRTHNPSFDFGIQYEGEFKNGKSYVVGAIFSPKIDITGRYEELGINSFDTVNYVSTSSRALELPTRYGIGFAYNYKSNLIFTVDYLHEKWSDIAFFGDLNTLKNSSRISIGAEYVPDLLAFKGYYKRVYYRAGFYYNSSYLKINDKSINEFGLTLGASLPVKALNINLALQLGQRGTTNNDLIKENFVNLSVSFTFYEAWFLKFLFD